MSLTGSQLPPMPDAPKPSPLPALSLTIDGTMTGRGFSLYVDDERFDGGIIEVAEFQSHEATNGEAGNWRPWPDGMPDVGVTLRRFAALFHAAPDLLAACEDALDLITWMSGADAFSPDGEAHEGWVRAQPRIDALGAAIRAAREVRLRPHGDEPYTRQEILKQAGPA